MQQIEELLAFKQMPWEAALKEAIQKVDAQSPAHAADLRSDLIRGKIQPQV